MVSRSFRVLWSLVAGAVAIVGVALVPIVAGPSESAAATVSKPDLAITSSYLQSAWDPGYIISDEQFYDGSGMSANQVQAFLNAKVPVCDYSRAQMPCLKDYVAATPSVAANLRCGAYSGASSERASDIIARVGQACGINPKTLLVLLQKEQSLVTDTWPYQSQYRAATGYGCPDTAPCDDGYVGFFSQVYGAAYAFRAYRANGGGPNYKAFQTNQIQWSPNAACGSSPVYIRNYATAGLYNYTPYQPNAAALGNPYGIGDGCSAYGNRNFFVLWYDWFGNPAEKSGPDYFAEYHTANGGNGGWLGTATSQPELVQAYGQAGYRQSFQNGSLYWSRSNGLVALSGAVLAKYLAIGGPTSWLGWPYGVTTDFTANGVTGKYQYFQGGTMYWTTQWGARVINPSTIKSAFIEFGATAGRPGWPIGDEVRVGSAGYMQAFQHGTLLVKDTGARLGVWAGIEDYYLAEGGPSGWMGWPSGNEVAWTAGGNSGFYQYFDTALVFSSPTTGTFGIPYGAIRDAYSATGGSAGRLGWPTGPAECAGADCVQAFQHGAIYLSSSYGARAVSGPLYDYYLSAGGPGGDLGWPTGNMTCAADGSCTQGFQAGEVTWTPGAAGGTVSTPVSFSVSGLIESVYTANGGPTGVLGAPTSPAESVAGGRWQSFAGGAIYQRGASAFAVLGELNDKYRQLGGPTGSFGWPLEGQQAWPSQGIDGVYQSFGNGLVYSNAVTGTFAVPSGPIRTTYGANGGVRGLLGWPTSDPVCAGANSCEQAFQTGRIYQAGGAAYIVTEPVLAKYQEHGGPSGLLGWPTSSAVNWTAGGVSGTYTYFQYGLIYTSSTTGTAIVPSGVLRNTYGAAGGGAGPLGWPTADPACDGSGRCEQIFQRGRIYQVAGAGHVLTGNVLTKFLASGGTAGALGWPSSSPVAWTASGVTGTYTYFDGGLVYDSAATGTAVVQSGPMRTAYGSAGGGAGPLGWPTADAICADPNRCEQVFQGGRIYRVGDQGYVLTSSVLNKYQSLGGTTGALGWPASSPIGWSANGTSGTYTYFDNALVYSNSTATAVVPFGPIRNAYGVMGGGGGVLGWPASDPVCAGDGSCEQQFQQGRIRTIPSGSESIVIAGPMLDAYDAAGGAGGPQGAVSSTVAAATAKNGTTGAWQYLGGIATIMYWSPATGVHYLVDGPIRAFYGTLGGVAGSTLGFPVGDQVCVGSVCTQAFQGGTIIADGTGPRIQ